MSVITEKRVWRQVHYSSKRKKRFFLSASVGKAEYAYYKKIRRTEVTIERIFELSKY
ncbi:hypothetical protein [Treponema phagedenis]|uniref:hypothetical protein n=1 Tax=Treponema phagedenis TaxID=162 RepID=UPI001CA3ADD1|nr:hypothetical protein [Treponema phagedenis]